MDAPVIVAPNGRPAREAESDDCPRCGSAPDKRVASSGFGSPHDVCVVCGFEFEGLTR